MVLIDRSEVLDQCEWSSPGVNHKKAVVFHETANKTKGAGAYAHHRLQVRGNPRKASWHYQVDDTVAVQTYNEDLRLWHSGSVAIPFTISVEICVNEDSDYDQAVQNAVDLGIDICERYNISINDVFTHNFFTGKNCPTLLLKGTKSWTKKKFIAAIEKGLNQVNHVSDPVIPNVSIDELARQVIAGKHGTGADRVRSLGKYYETVQKRVNELITGKPSTPPKPVKTIDQLVTETLAGIHGNGETRKKKLGVHYDVVQSIINGSPPKPDITDLVNRTLKGEFGNGEHREKALGQHYPAVQKRINQMFS